MSQKTRFSPYGGISLFISTLQSLSGESLHISLRFKKSKLSEKTSDCYTNSIDLFCGGTPASSFLSAKNNKSPVGSNLLTALVAKINQNCEFISTLPCFSFLSVCVFFASMLVCPYTIVPNPCGFRSLQMFASAFTLMFFFWNPLIIVYPSLSLLVGSF